jgi:hypothetical protein
MISVCIATYNGEKFIAEQLHSVLSQISGNDEIVISDDGSTDATLDVIRAIGANNMRIIVNKGQHGYTPNFENALKAAKGDVIFLCDQDDLWADNKISLCLQQLQEHDLIISDAQLIDADGKEICPSFFAQRHARSGLYANLIRFSYIGCCMAFKRNVLERALPFPSNHRYCTHDNWIALVGMAFFKTKIIGDKLVAYRRHGHNTSAGGLRKTTTPGFKLRYRAYLVYHLIMRKFSPLKR